MPASGEPPPHDRDSQRALALRFQRSLQSARVSTYYLAIVLGLVFRRSGLISVRLETLAAFFVISTLWGVFLYAVGRWQVLRHGRSRGEVVWVAFDVVLITWGIHVTGGFSSIWYVWYLASASVAAFVGGMRGVLGISVVTVGSYLGSFFLTGDIRGLDANLATAVGRMAFLHGAAYFSLRGIAELKARKDTIKRLVANESRKVEELTRLTTALEQANVEIREADRMKSQFLANMSHELRTPLNSIIGFSEILRGRLKDEIPEKYVKFLDNINSSGQHLLKIINDILDLSKIEAGKMEVRAEEIVVADAIAHVAQTMRGVAESRGIRIEVEAPPSLPTLEADGVKLRQVLLNLVANAVKFSPDGAVVRVIARAVSAADSPIRVDSLQIAVVDHGIGIDAKDHDLVFQEFRQADGTSARKFEGTGLGLALVRSLLALQGGTVGLDSAPGRGSTFTITLPVRSLASVERSASAPALTAETLSGAGGSRRRILVIEDDPTAYRPLAAALEAAGYLPLRARTGEEALQLAKTLRPSAITLDLVLPGLDGWEVLKTLKEDPATSGIPVVIISMIENRELGLALGVDDYFLKPLQKEPFLERLQQLVPASAAEGPPLILLIDDEPDVHEMLEALLLAEGYRLEHALSGEEGLRKAELQHPDLIILDLMMKRMDGFEVAARLESGAQTSRIPVLILTAQDLTPSDRERLSGKIAALEMKTELSHGRLVDVVDDLVRRRRAGPGDRSREAR